MKRLFLTTLCAALAFSAVAQEKEYPKPAQMTPEMTEYWTPQPRIVSPGDICTDSAPSDAIVLFDGRDLSLWKHFDGSDAAWPVSEGIATVDRSRGCILTKQSFGSCQLHLEWRIPEGVTGSSQHRGNSGVFFQGMYEVQILDNHENETYVNGMCGSVYKQTPPLVNAVRKPGEWNIYDIIYTAPVFKEDGTYLYRPRVTVILNGVLVQNNTEILGTTEWIGNPRVVRHGDGPIRIQSHGDPGEQISFRNIWIRPL